MKHLINSCDIKLLLHLFQNDARKIVFYDNKTPLDDHCPMDFVQYGDIEALEQYIKVNAVPISIINISQKDLSYLYQKEEVKCIIDFQNKLKEDAQKFHYINNPSGGMRWIFPSSASYPSYLSLYNGSGLKAKIYRLISQIAFFFGLKRGLSSGTFSVRSKDALLSSILEGLTYQNYSIFTGTVGPNRKMILEISTKKRTSHFIKIPLTEKSKGLVQQEFEQVQKLQNLEIKTFSHPTAIYQSGGLQLTNVAQNDSKNSIEFEAQHIEALAEIYQKTTSAKHIIGLNFWTEILDNLAFIESHQAENKLDYPQLFELVKELSEQVEPAALIQTSFAHGDFTPWNMYVSKEGLQIYDWELAQEAFPILYDFFHYIFQSHILIKGQGYQEIKQAILAFAKQGHFQKILGNYHFNINQYLKLYLLHISSYYLKLYMTQDHLHEQAHWLLNTWQEALADMISPFPKTIPKAS